MSHLESKTLLLDCHLLSGYCITWGRG